MCAIIGGQQHFAYFIYYGKHLLSILCSCGLQTLCSSKTIRIPFLIFCCEKVDFYIECPTRGHITVYFANTEAVQLVNEEINSSLFRS